MIIDHPYDKKVIIKLLSGEPTRKRNKFIFENAERKYEKSQKKSLNSYIFFQKTYDGKIKFLKIDLENLRTALQQLTPESRLVIMGENYDYFYLGAKKLAGILVDSGICNVKSIKLWGSFMGWKTDYIANQLSNNQKFDFTQNFLYNFACHMARFFFVKTGTYLECQIAGYLTEVYISDSHNDTYVCGRQKCGHQKTTKNTPWAKLVLQTVKDTFKPIIKPEFDGFTEQYKSKMIKYFS